MATTTRRARNQLTSLDGAPPRDPQWELLTTRKAAEMTSSATAQRDQMLAEATSQRDKIIAEATASRMLIHLFSIPDPISDQLINY